MVSVIMRLRMRTTVLGIVKFVAMVFVMEAKVEPAVPLIVRTFVETELVSRESLPQTVVLIALAVETEDVMRLWEKVSSTALKIVEHVVIVFVTSILKIPDCVLRTVDTVETVSVILIEVRTKFRAKSTVDQVTVVTANVLLVNRHNLVL